MGVQEARQLTDREEHPTAAASNAVYCAFLGVRNGGVC